MLLVEKVCLLPTYWSNQHLRKLNGVLGLETSVLSSNHSNFPYPFCTKITDKKAEVVEYLDTCDGTEDLSALILLSAMRKLSVEYGKFCETHCQSPLVQMQTIFVQFLREAYKNKTH